ncbi:MAG: TerC family protein [Rubrobacteraceae bacterium]
MIDFFSGEMLARLVGVLGVNLILSGDNAVVIALAAHRLEGANRRKAIIWGSVGAVVLRLIFAAVVAYLLAIPLLQVIGGVLLIYIAWNLVNTDPDDSKIEAGNNTWEAVRIIILADAVMSLDNVIALVGVSGGNFVLLAIGLATTVPLVIFGSAMLSYLLDRFPIFVYGGAGLLVYVAVEMIFEDEILHRYLEGLDSVEWLIALGCSLLFVIVSWLFARRNVQAVSTDKNA